MSITTVFTAIIVVWAIIIYNRLVRDKTRVQTAWSDIDVQLKRRHDLIPKLVEAVKQYAAYESASLAAVTQMRAQATQADQAGAVSDHERNVSQELSRLIVLAEAYPELQANASYLDLQQNLSQVEEHIQHARRYYNGAVRNLNIQVESFPDRLIAGGFGFKPANFFDLE